MKTPSIALLTLFMSMGALAEDEKDKHYMEVLSACSDSEVKEVVGLFVGTNLDLSCVKDSFDSFHASRELRYREYNKVKTSINNHEPKYLNINTTHIDKLKTITSLYIMEGGEGSSSGHDLLYSAGNKFWYLYPDGDFSEMNILKVNAEEEPELIIYSVSQSSRTDYYLLNLTYEKTLHMGSGSPDFKSIETDEITYSTSGKKSYFKGGGAFWYNLDTTHSFITDSSEDKFINTEGKYSSCRSKQDFIKYTGWENVSFEGLEEVCVTRY